MTNTAARLISIEGNIGSGKSTLLRLLKTHLPSVEVIL
jgi:deoxyadenosine/deoxycytidine kinase